jgi:ATP-dependent DNA helicase RecQ
MVSSGLLEIDISAYGALKIAPKGDAFLRGEIDFRFRPERKSKRAKTKESATKDLAQLSPDGENLYARLKALRLGLAQERGVPAYTIFPDKALIDMATKRPANEDEFGEVYGVGQAKLRKFGAVFLDAIAKAH